MIPDNPARPLLASRDSSLSLQSDGADGASIAGFSMASSRSSSASLASMRSIGQAIRQRTPRPPILPRRGTETPLEPPALLFPGLFHDVQMAGLFADQKVFADALPLREPASINQAYEAAHTAPDFKLDAFVVANFRPAPQKQVSFNKSSGRDWAAYVKAGWDKLTLAPNDVHRLSSLLAIQHRAVVPGGRFSEPNYWDMAFTLPGLLLDGRRDLAMDMLRNAASCIDRFGHVPNGFRTYQLSRSQPPVFAMMVQDLATHDGDDAIIAQFMPQMQAEHDFWMQGAETLQPGESHRRAACLPNGTVLNRHWDDRAEPRDESYLEDMETAHEAAAHGRVPEQVFRDLRAACESGWDFSARWFADFQNLHTVRTTQIVPVDLNCLMVNLERTIARGHRVKGNAAAAEAFDAKAANRTAAIRDLMWDQNGAMFSDVLLDGTQTGFLSAATSFPLRFDVATPDQAKAVAGTIRDKLLLPGGLVTTLHDTKQQWDFPNSWAPLQDIAVDGLQRHDPDLAREIGARWCKSVLQTYQAIGAIVEKYNAAATTGADGVGAGGEYDVQVGFAWTNGILRKLTARYPDDIAARLQADQL